MKEIIYANAEWAMDFEKVWSLATNQFSILFSPNVKKLLNLRIFLIEMWKFSQLKKQKFRNQNCLSRCFPLISSIFQKKFWY